MDQAQKAPEAREFITELYKTALVHRCATDVELFTAHYFPHYCKHPFNSFHHDYFAAVRFGERRVRRASGAPRGYAKSTIAALVKPIHDICYELETFIVLFSNTEVQALGKLKDIRSELMDNAELIADFSIRFQRKTVAEGSFVVYSDKHRCKLEAYGTGAQIRGIRDKASRPSKLIFDDVEHSDEVEKEALRSGYEQWYKEDVLRAGDEDTNVEFIGTVLHKKSLLRELLDNPLYSSRLYKAMITWPTRSDLWEQWRQIVINKDNDHRLEQAWDFYVERKDEMDKGAQVLWPSKEPLYALMLETIEMGMRSFMKEKQNDPQGSDDKLFTQFHWYREIHDPARGRGILIESTGHFIKWADFMNFRCYAALDPATGQTTPKVGKKGDFTSLLTGYHDAHRKRLFVHHDFTRRVPPTLFIEQLINQHKEFEYEKVGIETNLYRNLLLPNIQLARKAQEKAYGKVIQLPLYDIEAIENKHKRIYTLEPKLTNAWILLNRALSEEYKGQLDDFPNGDHDDAPDATEMLWGLVSGRYKMSAVNLDAVGGR